MFQTFSGNSRRVRQVNLSGRSPGTSRTTAPSAAGAQNAIAHAQQERLLRQRERDRLSAAQRIQRVWRGYRARASVKASWRQQWDHFVEREGLADDDDEARMIAKLRLLLQFVDASLGDDRYRLDSFVTEFLALPDAQQRTVRNGEWREPLLRLAKLSLEVLALGMSTPDQTQRLLQLVSLLVRTYPDDISPNPRRYYQVMSRLSKESNTRRYHDSSDTTLLVSCVLAPLEALTSKTLDVYEDFAWNYLTTPDLPRRLGDLESLVAGMNYRLLIAALAASLGRMLTAEAAGSEGRERIMWLLAYIIHVRGLTHGDEVTAQRALEPDYLFVVSALLSASAAEIGAGIDPDTLSASGSDVESDEGSDPPRSHRRRAKVPLPQFVRQQILSLWDQRNVTSLLMSAHDLVLNIAGSSPSSKTTDGSGVMMLASYVLLLLRIFPRKADDIRMWLYLGSASAPPDKLRRGNERVSALRFFWKAARDSEVFRLISRDSRNTVDLIRLEDAPSSRSQADYRPGAVDMRAKDHDWRIILVFLELYSFVLKIIDDDEFFSGNSAASLEGSEHGSTAWTRETALPLEDLKGLTVFLKNLGFAMYWYASEMQGLSEPEPDDESRNTFLRTYVSTAEQHDDIGTKTEELQIAGINGMTFGYVRGTVTGVLRMLYERDSRRQFLPRDHWLMPLRLDMEAFIPAVVLEEEKRHSAQGDLSDDEEPHRDEAGVAPIRLIGTARARRARNLEARRMRQSKSTRKKFLELVTPRLEILQNMPYLIPFATRVRIFREFVSVDQTRRRGGFTDPDHWRGAILSTNEGRDIIVKHHAKIRRDNVFEDAYSEFYQLADGLKEPIQITFVDKFGAVEAGIDGGGVTKEFLTSVTQEAFSGSSGLNLFVENDKHLLYPNPAAMDERKDLLRQAGVAEGSPEWNELIRHILRRYEFLGRIIGKCMYEGILVNVGFAPFFLLKWALTGGLGSASGETSYRANLNDLRDLDDSLYQGLLQLKNYPGDVEDFSLNFTITDTISTPESEGPDGSSGTTTRTITRELKPNGSNIPVTNQNRLLYISYVARHRLQTQPRLQTNAFLRGLGDIIQPSWLSMFNQAELQTLISGDASEIDVSDLRRHTNYGGVYVLGDDQQEHPTVQLFWEVMSAFSDADRRKVLQFVTSTPRAPLLGFGQLNPWFSIRDAGDNQERLPSTSTCVNLLKLPRYSTARILREKLLYAIHSGAGFDLS